MVLERDGREWDKVREADRTMPRWWIMPDRRLAAFVAHRSPLARPVVKPLCDDSDPSDTAPSRHDAGRDPRPLMAVEFPPQHVAEQAFFRQFEAEPSLPEPPAQAKVKEDEALVLRLGTLAQRIATRKDIEKRFASTDEFKQLLLFRARFDLAAKAEALPADQQIYVGAAFLDPVASRVARRVARDIEKEQRDKEIKPDTEVARAYAMRVLPDVELLAGELSDLRRNFGINSPNDEWAEQPGPVKDKDGKEITSATIAEYLKRREELKDRRDPDYAEFRSFFAQPLAARQEDQPEERRNAMAAAEVLRPKPFTGRQSFIRSIKRLSPADSKTIIAGIVADVEAHYRNVTRRNEELFRIPAEARISGRSRLVFRVPADDYPGGRPRTEGRAAGAFPFTFDALTNWGSFDLAVVRRAEKVFEPIPGGRAPRRWDRNETREEAEKLLHQGITRGDVWSRREREGRADPRDGCPAPLKGRSGRITGAQRMAEIAAASRDAPRWDETAIEMPFRLMLSPAQDALWRTPLPLPRRLELTPGPEQPAPLWTTHLNEPRTAGLRAVWSPDYRPEALLDPDIGGPPRGPWAPWAMARSVTSRDPFKASEANEVERFRASLDAYDRHELVALTSLHGLPVRGRRKEDGTLADTSQIHAPAGFELRDVKLESLTTGATPADWSAIYKPQTIVATELTLTALGGTFDAETDFVPPASAKVEVTPWTQLRELLKPPFRRVDRNLFDAFSIERWRHHIVLGRDTKVEVVYKGFLFPLGHRASLVKLTERRFMAITPGGPPVAFLVQRMFLRVGTPEKRYPVIAQPNGGRRWPVTKLDILVRGTLPDIVDPTDAYAPEEGQDPETRNGRIFLRADVRTGPMTAGLVFWPRVRAARGGELRFELRLDERGPRVCMPLIFVDNTAANDETAMVALAKYYNKLEERDFFRHCHGRCTPRNGPCLFETPLRARKGTRRHQFRDPELGRRGGGKRTQAVRSVEGARIHLPQYESRLFFTAPGRRSAPVLSGYAQGQGAHRPG